MAGKTLSELKNTITVVNSSKFEENLKSTLISNYVDSVNNYLIKQLNSQRGNISLPTMQNFLEMNPGYKEELVSLYSEKMYNVPGYETVDVDTMITQAALFDGICFVYDSFKDEYCLATMNLDILYDFKIEYNMLRQIMMKNLRGVAKGYRIDIEYSNSGENFSFKAVNAHDFDIDDSLPDTSPNKRFFLVPYIFVVQLMKMIEAKLNKGSILRIHQNVRGTEKVRFVSKNKDVLSKMCDIPEAVRNVSTRYFPLKGFFYAPVVGAPSTTAMVTNINIFDIEKIKVASEEDFKKYSVHKPVNPVKDLIGETLVSNKLMCIKSIDEDRFTSIIDKLPYRDNLLPKNAMQISEVGISKYMHSLTPKGINMVYNVVEVINELDRRMKLFNGEYRVMTQNDINNINKILKERICRIVIQRKDCKLSSVMCTNNTNVLKYIYGDDYVKVYEGFNMKYYAFYNRLNYIYNEDDITSDLLDTYGLPCDDEDVEYVKDYFNYKKDPDILKRYFAERLGIDVKRTNSFANIEKNGLVLSRSLSAYVNVDGDVVDYYKYIDRKHIVSGIIF